MLIFRLFFVFAREANACADIMEFKVSYARFVFQLLRLTNCWGNRLNTTITTGNVLFSVLANIVNNNLSQV